MKIELLENETLEDLQCGGLKLIQKRDGFRFGTDAVLLADFAKTVHSEKTLDLCSGTGIIPLLLSHKTKTAELHALEIQEEIAETAMRSIAINGLSERISFKCGDLKNAAEYYPAAYFDLITCNPPYMEAGSAILNKADTKTISRHEVMCTLDDIFAVSARLLRFGGHIAMVHRPNRLVDVLAKMREHLIEPKVIRFVHSSADKAPILFLVDGMYHAKRDIKILPPLILYNNEGQESDELKKIYERK